MRRSLICAWIFVVAVLLLPALAQPPGGANEKGPPKYEVGKLFTPPLLKELKLTDAQAVELAAIEKGLKARLDALLTPEQKKLANNFMPLPKGPRGENTLTPLLLVTPSYTTARFLPTGGLKLVGDEKSPFSLRGDAVAGVLGDLKTEYNGYGIRLLSGVDQNKDGMRAGGFYATVTGLTDNPGRWYRLRVRAMAQENFSVKDANLTLEVGFFKDKGTNPLDGLRKSVFEQIELERKSLLDAGTNKNLGSATWRYYTLDFRTPFAEVDTLRVGMGFQDAQGGAERSELWVSDVEIAPIPDPADYRAPAKATPMATPALKSLVSLGGRWYYDPRSGSRELPVQFDHTNADRLIYLTDRLETPFSGNMSAWLRPGYYDIEGKMVEKEKYVPDSVVITFTKTHLVMKSKNLPNHPTAVFPDRARFLDGNPNVVREKRDTWYLPLDPKPNPNRPAPMTMENKQGLPMGPIGVAVNGVVFFNPFDHIADADAVHRVDRCCGHPGPMGDYHYHKYPVCINTPWADDGQEHSQLLGFAFDGFPVYGPYESKGVLAKDSKDRPLNIYNLHTDDARGPHYHVTPGKFPHIIGGYWGSVDPLNRGGKKGPPKK
ncbi:MAG: YHYH protein [Fimbriiglobus sp.]